MAGSRPLLCRERTDHEANPGRLRTAASCRKARLTQDDPAPQIVYRVAVKLGEPLMVKVRIRYSDSHRAAIEARSRRILSGARKARPEVSGFGFLGVLGELGAK